MAIATGQYLERLCDLGERLAAGFLEIDEATPLQRMARGVRRQLEGANLPAWQGEPLYPSGCFSWYQQGSAISFHYSHSLVVNRDMLAQRSHEGDAEIRAAYTWLAERLGDYPQVGAGIDRDIRLGGANYTHSILNYGRIVREGLSAYARRIAAGLENARSRGDVERERFDLALEDTLAGIRAAHARGLTDLVQHGPCAGAAGATWKRLVAALQHVPWEPARSFYEGLAAINFLYYLDGCDNLGLLDQDLGALFEATSMRVV